MPLPTIADTFRVAFEWTLQGGSRTATNVMHYLAPNKTESEVFNALQDNVTDDMWNTLPDIAQCLEVVVTKLDGTPDGRVFPTNLATGAWAGSGGAQFIPQGCTLVKLATGATGRSGRGRIYLPWITEASQFSGLVDDLKRTAAQAAWIAFSNAMIADGIALAVASYKNDTAAQVLALTVESSIATQRRRHIR